MMFLILDQKQRERVMISILDWIQIPNTFIQCEFLHDTTKFWKNTNFKSIHGKRIDFGVKRNKGIFPFNSCKRSRNTILDIPKHSNRCRCKFL